MKKVSLLLVLLLIWCSTHSQQDGHFSMFFANPVQLNPGAAGHGLGTVQIFTNFRTQWFTLSSQPFRSFTASFDSKILERTLSNGFIGLGINMLNDVSGDGKYTLNVIQIPLNYSIELDKNSYLSVGLQPGVYTQHMNESVLYFDNQWTPGGFNTALSNGEPLGSFNLLRFDLGAGVFYNSFFSESFSLQAGISGAHLTAQKVNFYSVTEKLYRNFQVFGQAHIWPNDNKLSYHPAVFAMFQGPNFEATFGNNFEYALKPSSRHTGHFDGMALSFGLYYRVLDAFIANIIYKAGPLTLGISYDTNLSRLSTGTNGVGAVEAFLRFCPYIKPKFGSPRIR